MKMTQDIHRLGQQIGRDLAAAQESAQLAHPFTVPQMLLLEAVCNAPNSNQSQLVNLTGIDRSTLSDMAARLVAEGVMTRKRDVKIDARAYSIHVTANGSKLFYEQRPMLVKVEKGLAKEAKALAVTW